MNAAEVQATSFQRSPASRLLVFGGISLILGGMLLGEIFAIFISHVASAQIRKEWTTSMIPAMADTAFSLRRIFFIEMIPVPTVISMLVKPACFEIKARKLRANLSRCSTAGP